MTSDVTIRSRPYEQIAFPPLCCCCLEPATTTTSFPVRVLNMQTGPQSKRSFSFPLAIPYCELHKQQAELFGRYAFIAGVSLFIIAVALSIGFDLGFGPDLRAFGSLIWWGSLVALWIGLAIGVVILYQVGRSLLARRYPILKHYFFNGGLGTSTRMVLLEYPPDKPYEPLLAVTFRFSNDRFAQATADLHASEARKV